jgi:hypothetical protein
MSADRILASASLTGSGLVGNGGASVYYGYTVTVVTATAAINIRKGSVSGQIVDVIPTATAAGQSKSLAHGLQCEGGVFVDFNGGTGTLVIHYEG